ncbi:glycosyltransferase family 39 protein [bacterium]|nr:glycosyltransferase family 39 protein [bacterium]
MHYFSDIKLETQNTIHRIYKDFKSLNLKLFIIILFIGILFRIISFGMHTSLHTDEALYAKWAASIGYNYNIGFTISEVDKPPLFYYILGASIFLLGPNDYAVKMPGLIFGILMIPLVTLLALNLGKQKAALWAAFFYSLSPFEILYSPTVFAETTCIFFSLFVLLLIIYKKPVLSGIFFGLALSVKQSVIFFIPLYLFFLFMRSHRFHMKNMLKFLKGFLIICIPLFIWVLFFSSRGFDIFTAICQKRFFTISSGKANLMGWFSIERFFTGNLFSTYIAVTFIFLARILYAVKYFSKKNKHDLKRFLEIFSLLVFVVSYDLVISLLDYPLYSRYLLIISSSFIILFALSLNLILKRVSAQFKIFKKQKNLTPLLYGLIISYWIFKTPVHMQTFPDGANYSYSESIKPTTEFIKQNRMPAAVYYTDETWPWIDWYFFKEKEKGLILKKPANFKTQAGIKQLLNRMNDDKDKLEKMSVLFIINPSKDKNVFKLLEQETGLTPAYEKIYTSQPVNSTHPAYDIYRVNLESILK